MIPLVEDYLSELIQGRFDDLKSNPNKINTILNTSQNRLTDLGVYLQANRVHVIKGYPRTPAQLPCVCIMLAGEQETQEGLGDYADYDDFTERNFVETLRVVDNNAGILQMPYLRTNKVPITRINSIVNVTTGGAIDKADYYISNESLGLIAFLPEALVDDDDSLTIDYDYVFSSTSGLQTLYECNYRLEAWSDNGDLTVDLYHLTKFALLWGRDNLLGHGLVQQKLSGADFEPATSYFPDFVYRRALSFWCQLTTSIPTDEETYLSQVSVNQTTISIDGSGL